MSELSLARDVADLTTVLARLGTGRPVVEPSTTGLDAALHARAAVLALTRQVLADVHQAPTPRLPGFAELHAQPAAVMTWALHHHPRVEASQSPIDVARSAPPGSRTALWEHAATLATRTHLRWERSDVAEQSAMAIRASPARRPLIADLAAAMTVLTHCEPAMAAVASQLGDHARATGLEASSASPLRLAAEATWRTKPPDAAAWDVRLAPDARRLGVLPIRDVTNVPQGLTRLAVLLTGQLDISPQHTALLISGQSRIALALAARIPAAGLPPAARPRDPASAERDGRAVAPAPGPVLTREGLLAYARALTGTWNHRDDALSTVARSDPRPVQQIGECVRALQARAPASIPATVLIQTARGLDAVLVATCAAVESQLQRASWMTNASGEHAVSVALRWRPCGAHERPHAADALHSLRTSRALPAHQPHRAHLITAAAVTAASSRPARTTPPGAVHAPHR